MTQFSNQVIQWYEEHKRDLPWRRTRDPYAIWLSEIILQQTRVEQGLPYWERFMEAYPTVDLLAGAPEQEVLKLWQGLGYYSRARNLRTAAIQVMEEFNGQFPTTYEDIIQLKGVGAYTAAAIASFAFDEPKAVVDGNVFRLLSRAFGIENPIDSTQGKKLFSAMAQEHLPQSNAAIYNQAIMEFGALQCTPKSPDCGVCPLMQDCIALRQGRVDQLPVKAKKIKRKNRYFDYLLARSKSGQYYIRQRGAGDIWQGLYEFPKLEFDRKIPQQDLTSTAQWQQATELAGNNALSVSNPVKHVLTHQDIFARLIELSIPIESPADDWIAVDKKGLLERPLPRLMELLIERFL